MIAVILGAALAEVAVALTELDPITVTRTTTVYVEPLPADWTVNTTGRVNPIKAEGGSKVIWAPADMVAKVALLDRTTSEALIR